MTVASALPRTRRGAILLYAALSVVLFGAYLTSSVWFTGHPTLALDDGYIFLHYAEGFAEGHPFVYEPGDLPTMGMTSKLYPLLLVPGALAGLRGDALALYVFVLQALLVFASFVLLDRLLRVGRLPGRVAVLGTLALATTGVFSWAAFAGMETALVTALLLAAAGACLSERTSRAPWRSALLLGALAVSRPEAMLFVACVAVPALAFEAMASGRRVRLPWLLVPVLFIAADLGTNLALTGHLSPSTGPAKSPLYVPGSSPAFILQHASAFWSWVLRTILTGIGGRSPLSAVNTHDADALVPPLSLLFFFLAAIPLAAREIRTRRAGPHATLVLWGAFGLVAVGLLSGLPAHQYRYLVPFAVGFIAYLPLGALRLGRCLRSRPSGRAAGAALAVFVIGYGALGTFQHALAYGRVARGFREYRDAMAWAARHLPAEAPVLTIDVGAAATFGSQKIVDLMGLTTAGMRESTVFYADFMGSKIEELRTWPAAQRPRFYLGHRVRWEEYNSQSHLDPLRQKPVHCFGSPPSMYPSVGRDLCFFALDWDDDFRMNERPCTAEVVALVGNSVPLLHLDVARLSSERANGYRALMKDRDSFPSNRSLSRTCDGSAVAEGVRGVDAGEVFRLDAPAGRDVLLVARRAYSPEPAAVFVNGTRAGEMPAVVGGPGWSEPMIRIPAGLLRAGSNEIRIEGSFIEARIWAFGISP